MTADLSHLIWNGEHLPLPTLFVDDVSAIPFLVDIPGVEEYQHRGRIRAGDGDLFAVVTPATEGYEEYARDRLRLGSPTMLRAEPVDGLLKVARACAEGTAFARLVDRAREAGGMVIHPYMGNDDVWQLAARIARESGAPCVVIGPPPTALWIANDKASFNEVVVEALDESWIIETRLAGNPVDMAAHLTALAGTHRRVGLKRTRCASAMGNQVWESRALLAGDVEREVRAFLERTEWPHGEPVLAVPWLDTDLSPSTQMWIPPAGTGPPRLDGIYEQILEGTERVFVGSRPSTLPQAVNRALGESALAVAGALQALGYYGRCSFDYLVVGDPEGEFHAMFTECNGRWGGTSTPMHLLDRLLGGDPRPPYRAQDFAHPDLVGVEFSEIAARLGDSLFDPVTRTGRFVLYNVGPLAKYGKLDVIAMGDTQAEAETAMLEELPRRLGLALA